MIYAAGFILVIVFGVLPSPSIGTFEGGEECSRFGFEMKMMERLVIMEQKNNEIETLKERLKVLETQHMELMETFERQRKDDETSKGAVVFTARLTTKSMPLRAGQVLVFHTIIENIGHGYNPGDGIFRAPINGSYSFSVNVCLGYNTWIVFAIMKGNEVLSETIIGNKPWTLCADNSAMAYLQNGERVYVKVSRVSDHGDRALTTYFPYTSFTGVLINSFSLV